MQKKQLKILTSVVLGTSIIFGGMVSTASAVEKNASQYGVINENSEISIWNCQEGLNQNQKSPYEKESIVVQGSKIYKCKRFHYPQSGWKPSDSPMFWKTVGKIPEWNAQEELTQENKSPYEKGDIVMYNSQVYKCKRFHYAQPGWNPCEGPMFWELIK